MIVYIDGDIFVGEGHAFFSLVGDFYLVERAQAAHHADGVLGHRCLNAEK